jgi:hypothetical protein
MIPMANSSAIRDEQGGVQELSLTPVRKTKRKRYVKPGDVNKLRAVLWQTLVEVEAICTNTASEPELKLKAGHALATLSGSYLKVLEVTEQEDRLKALEEQYRELSKAGSKAGKSSPKPEPSAFN